MNEDVHFSGYLLTIYELVPSELTGALTEKCRFLGLGLRDSTFVLHE